MSLLLVGPRGFLFFDEDEALAVAQLQGPAITYGASTIRLRIDTPANLVPVSYGGAIPPTGAYALQAGALPTGLALDEDTGIISGTPTVLETQTFTIRVTNEVSYFDRVQTLIIRAPLESGGGSETVGAPRKQWKRKRGIFSPPEHNPQGNR